MLHVGTSKPVIHIAQTNTSRSGSSGSLNLLSRSSFCIRFAVGQDVEALLLQVVDLVLRLADDHRHVDGAHPVEPLGERLTAPLSGAVGELLLPRRQLGRPAALRTLSYIRTAVALSMATNIALPR